MMDLNLTSETPNTEKFEYCNADGDQNSEADKCTWDDDKYNDDDDEEDGDESMPELQIEDTKNSKDDDMKQNEIVLDSTNEFFVMQLIKQLEEHEVLWYKSSSPRKRKLAVNSILSDMIECYNGEPPLTYKTLANAVTRILKAFRYDRRRIDTSKKEYKPKYWFFAKLQFLEKAYMDDVSAKALAEDEHLALPLPNLTDEQHLQLFEIYKSFPCLWDIQHVGFRFKDKRDEALDEMLDVIRTKLKLILSVIQLQTKINRINYAATQQKQQKLQCELVEEEFAPTCKYYEHISFLLDNVGPFQCPFCKDTFNTFDMYTVHKSKHDGSLPFTCPVCNRGFVSVRNCNVHVRRHTRNFKWECKYCQKGFVSSSEMNVHERIHTGEKPYFCELCGQSFRSWTFFDIHMRRHQNRYRHKCNICSKGFYEMHKLTEHMKGHLKIRDKVCNVCDKAFTTSKYLRQHKEIHEEKKKYSCKICSKNFAQRAGLTGHMRSHATIVSSA